MNQFGDQIEKDGKRWLALKYRVSEQQIVRVFEFFRANGIEPILIKGWSASLFYPEPFLRSFSDIDIAVAPGEYQRALNLIDSNKINVDLHEGLRHHDTSDWEYLFENSKLVNIDDTKIRILCAEDALRVLCVHWLTDGGAYKDKLWDIFYAVANRPVDFEWEKCLNVVSAKRRLWIIYTIGLAHKYLGLDIRNLPFESEASEIPPWIIKTVEREWATDVRLRPLDANLFDRKQLWKQIIKRIPPNPIQATVESEGDFDDRSRIRYQANSILMRTYPSVRRIIREIKQWKKRKKHRN